MKQTRYIISFFVFMTVTTLAMDFKLENIDVFKHPKNELAIIGGSVTLPGEGVGVPTETVFGKPVSCAPRPSAAAIACRPALIQNA